MIINAINPNFRFIPEKHTKKLFFSSGIDQEHPSSVCVFSLHRFFLETGIATLWLPTRSIPTSGVVTSEYTLTLGTDKLPCDWSYLGALLVRKSKAFFVLSLTHFGAVYSSVCMNLSHLARPNQFVVFSTFRVQGLPNNDRADCS